MKKMFVKLMLLPVLIFIASLSASAQIYVKIRPVAPVEVRTAQPSPAHVWIGEEWREDGGNYKYSGGHWEAPPHPGYRWHAGHWNHDKDHGDRWMRGSWRADKKK